MLPTWQHRQQHPAGSTMPSATSRALRVWQWRFRRCPSLVPSTCCAQVLPVQSGQDVLPTVGACGNPQDCKMRAVQLPKMVSGNMVRVAGWCRRLIEME